MNVVDSYETSHDTNVCTSSPRGYNKLDIQFFSPGMIHKKILLKL